MSLLGVVLGVVVLGGLAALLFRSRSGGAKPERTGEPRENSEDTERILARMKAMGEPTLLMEPATSGAFSKLGGDPELPAGMAWPQGPEGPLAFLAQISLADARRAGAPDWLPGEGAIYAFGDDRYGMRDQIRIVISNGEAGPPVEPPANQKRGWRRPERRVDFTLRSSLPSLDWLNEDVRKIDVSDDDLDELADLPALELGKEPHHRIGGYPVEIQEDCLPVQAECEARGLPYKAKAAVPPDIERAAADWRLLLQIDSDRALKMNWGDGGQFYVLIREADARAGDFSQTVTLSQTY